MDIRYGVAEDIGLRDAMEDSYAIWDMATEFFGAEVFDGHAGRSAATLAAEFLMPHFLSEYRHTREDAAVPRVPVPELIREAYLATDRYIVGRGAESGTAVATLYIQGERFYAANAGDSRVVIGAGSKAVQLTLDHKPGLPEERTRIEVLGGSVISWGVPRVQGILAMSRALGDPGLKPFVSPEPRVVEGLLGRENDVAVIACDGVWDIMTTEEAVGLARMADDPEQGAAQIVRRALERGSTDNVTVIVLDLRARTAELTRETMEIVGVLDYATLRVAE